MRILNHQVKALRIHRQLQRINAELFKYIERQLNKKYHEVFAHEKPDRKTWDLVTKLIVADRELKKMGSPAESANIAVHKLLEALGIGEANTQSRFELTKEGDFYSPSSPKKVLSFRNAKKRLTLFRAIGNKFQSTTMLTTKALIENNTATRKHIGTLNARIKSVFKISNFIESKGNGYRINPAYRLTKK